MNRVATTYEEAEEYRNDPQYWSWAVYRCPYDPRPIVRNRWFFGWTWNLAAKGVAGWIIGMVLLFAIPAWVMVRVLNLPQYSMAFSVGALLVVCAIAHRVASGPN